MNRRDFLFCTPTLLVGCGSGVGADMPREYDLVRSPQMREHKNVYDWGVEGVWTPTFTFDTPGNLAVTYGVQLGRYKRQGEIVDVMFTLTADITHTTAAGTARIGGLPFTQLSGGLYAPGALQYNGITIANYMDISTASTTGQTYIRLVASGSAVADTVIGAAHIPTGLNKTFIGSLRYTSSDA